MKRFFRAVSLLTILPAPASDAWTPGESGRAAVWYPWVGLALGGLVWAVWWLACGLFPAEVAGVLAVTAWVALTGGLHLDGLADACDGLGYAGVPAQRLEVMRDPRLGAFGGLGLGLALLLKAAALSALPVTAGGGVLLAAVLARWFLLPAGLEPLAKPGGMAGDFAQGLTRSAIGWGAWWPLMLTAALGWRGALALGAAWLVTASVLALARARLGGLTGDILGLLVESVEIAVLLVWLMDV